MKAVGVTSVVWTITTIVCLVSACGSSVHEDYYPSGKLRARVTLDRDTLANGPTTVYFESGIVEAKGFWSDDKRTGEWQWFDSLGSIRKSCTYQDDSLHGICTEYYPNGLTKIEAPFVLGKMHGTARTYYPSGALESLVKYDKGLENDTAKYYHANGLLSMLRVSKNDTMLKFVEYDTLGNQTRKYVLYPTEADLAW